jgi:hypothetical protein
MRFYSPANDSGSRAAGEARTAAREAKTETEDLRRDVERLLLITEALWRITKEKLQCTDAELVQQIHDIDLEDGKLDGRKAISPARECPNCKRMLIKHRATCMYCGKPVEFLPFER